MRREPGALRRGLRRRLDGELARLDELRGPFARLLPRRVDGGLQLTTKDPSMLQKYYDEVYTKAAEKADDGKYNDQQRLHYQNLKEMVDAPEGNPVAPRPFASPGGPAQFAGAALGP